MAKLRFQPMAQLIPTVIYALLGGFIIILATIWGMLTKGPRTFFRCQRRDVRPEVLSDPELGTHHFARMKRIRLHYVAKGSEERPLLLFLHGFPEFWYSWRHQLVEFSKNYRAVALDMRGFGESDKPQGVTEYHMDKLTEDIKNFIEHIGYTKCHLVGHDWGGGVAWMFATEYPEMVEKLICCNNPNPYAMQLYMTRHPSQLLKSWYMFMFQLPWLPEIFLRSQDLFFISDAFKPVMDEKPLNFTQEDIEAFKYTYRHFADLTGPINYYRAILRYRPTPLPESLVQAPTLIIWGTKDMFLEKGLAPLSARYVNNQRKVRYIVSSGHWVQQEEPELVNQYITEFLSDQQAK